VFYKPLKHSSGVVFTFLLYASQIQMIFGGVSFLRNFLIVWIDLQLALLTSTFL